VPAKIEDGYPFILDLHVFPLIHYRTVATGKSPLLLNDVFKLSVKHFRCRVVFCLQETPSYVVVWGGRFRVLLSEMVRLVRFTR